MRNVVAFYCIFAALALAACTPKPMVEEPPAQRARLDYLTRTANVPVTCTDGADCNEKWARAHEWVERHSQYSIKSSTASEIITQGPIEPTTDAAFTVTKTPNGPGLETITFTSTCGKILACVPTTLELNSEFNNFVLYNIRQGNF